MEGLRLGRLVRALRHRRRWRQADLGHAAGVDQRTVSRIEAGRIGRLQVDTLTGVAAALDAELVVNLRWRGGDIDRLLDEGHAALVGRIATELVERGWIVQPEVSFAVYAERGSIDLVALEPVTSALLVVEVKTAIVSVEETLRRHDVKARLGPRVVAERFGWRPRWVARLLVLPDASVARRRVARHETVFGRAYPMRGQMLRSWLRHPTGMAAGLLFLGPSSTPSGSARRPPTNVRRIRSGRQAPS